MSSLYLRQQDVVDQPRLATTPITVIGAGAIGSFVVLGLAKIGAGNLTVWDPDVFEEHNLSNQWYAPRHIGMSKVTALRRVTADMTDTLIDVVSASFTGPDATEVTICCVDSMDARVQIWKGLLPRPALYVDARMGAEVGRLLCVGTFGSWYEEELYPSNEAFRAPCTARATMYCASGLAALVCAQVANYVSGRPTRQQTTIDFRNTIMI